MNIRFLKVKQWKESKNLQFIAVDSASAFFELIRLSDDVVFESGCEVIAVGFIGSLVSYYPDGIHVSVLIEFLNDKLNRMERIEINKIKLI